ncbi:MAG: rhodanese-like domain-containing protein [Proteobacteria bacterium]|jgi:rhodanese-related sulfurtransferase|nr:rhodanese-like domain-containing protein [Pseudomonadota bacterium]MDA1291410.1 rhodanese-like domain-containing protein [Pseudomonadota bacterium]
MLMLKLIAAASVSSFFFGLFGVSWESVDEKIQSEFPGVQSVSTDVLFARYEASDAKLPIIIDVREDGEFRVSHLDDALHLESAEAISSVIAERGLGKDTEIIVYCSVGYRSASVAADLQARGFTKVLNLEHSLFEWANKGYPMTSESESGSTDKVHPFNKAWSVLVDDSLHAYPDK